MRAAHPARLERLVIVDIAPDIHPPGMARIRTMMANAPEAIESEEWAVETAAAANPRADLGELRHRIKHAIRRAPDGVLDLEVRPRAARDDAAGRAARDPRPLGLPAAHHLPHLAHPRRRE